MEKKIESINAVLQVLFRIKQFRQAVYDSRDTSPSKEIAEIFDAMMNPDTPKEQTISTVRLTNVIPPKWRLMQDCCDTLSMFIEEVSKHVADIKKTFTLRIHETSNVEVGDDWFFLNLYQNCTTVQTGIRGRLKNELKIALPPILLLRMYSDWVFLDE